MRTSALLVYCTFLFGFSAMARHDTIIDYIEKAPTMREMEERIIMHGGRLLYNDPDHIPELASKVAVLAKKNKSERLAAAVYNLKGLYSRHKGNLDSSVHYHLRSLAILRKLPPHIQLSREYNHLSIAWHQMGQYERYLVYNDSALAIADAVQDRSYEQVLLNNRAYIFLQLRDTVGTKKLLKDILPRMDSTPGSKAATYENLARIYLWQNDIDSAKLSLELGLALAEKAGENRLNAELLQQLGNIYFKEGELSKAQEKWNKAISIFDQLGDAHGRLYAQAQMAHIFSENGQKREAIERLDLVLAHPRVQKYPHLKVQVLEQKAEFHEQLSEYAPALTALRATISLSDSIRGQEVKKELAQLEAKYQARQKEQELAALRQENDLKTAKANQLYTLFTAAFLLLVLFIVYLRHHYHSRQRIAEKEQARLNTEVSKRQLEEQKLRDEIELKNKQLTTKALSLSERNELLTRLLDILRKARAAGDSQRSDLLKMAEREVSLNLKSTSEWKGFQKYFEEINSGFIESLRSQYPQLSQREIRLLSLSKLGLNTKEMSNLLHIAPDSVKMARYRLKKKLSLAEEESLDDFLSTVGGRVIPFENSSKAIV